MDVGINPTCCQNHLFSGNYISRGSYNHIGIDASHHIRIASLANPNDTISFDTNIRLDNPRDRIYNESVGNHDIQGVGSGNTRVLKKYTDNNNRYVSSVGSDD